MKKSGIHFFVASLVILCLLVAPIAETGIVLADTTEYSAELTDWITSLYYDKNGLPTSEANTVLQTSDGYIWIGSYGGLIRYNGSEFHNYSLDEDGIPASGIRTLYEDNKNRLIIGTNDSGIYIYENGVFTPCTAETNTVRSVRCITQSPDGIIYVGTAGGLMKLTEEDSLVSATSDERLKQTIYSLTSDENGVIWGTAGLGDAFAVADGELCYWFPSGELCEEENYSVLADENRIYIGTSGQILIRLTLHDTLYTEDSYQIDFFETNGVETINALYKTRNGQLWLGSNTGTAWMDENMELHQPSGFSTYRFINRIEEDYEGNVWLASTRSGVYFLSEGRFLNANQQAGLEGLIVNATAMLGTDLYIGTDSGLYLVDSEWNRAENELTQMLSGVRIRQVVADSVGSLWISTYSDTYGLVQYKPKTNRILCFTVEDGLLSNQVRSVYETADKRIVVATSAGINIISKDTVIKSYAQGGVLENPVMLCIAELPNQTLLAGSDGNGIYVIHGDEITNIGQKEGLDAGVVLRMCRDDEMQGTWISAGSSLYFMTDDFAVRKIERFQEGIGSVFDIKLIHGQLWIFKSSGVIAAKREELLGTGELNLRSYGPEHGMTANLTANAWNLQQGDLLYLCTVDGINLFDTAEMERTIEPPRTVIEQIVVEDEDGAITVYSNTDSVEIPSTVQRVTIYFASLSYNKLPCSINYYLNGFEDIIHESNEKGGNSISYTNLPGGTYQFCMTAKFENGAVGEEKMFSLEKKLSLMEQPAFWVLLVLATLLLSGLAVWYIMHRKVKNIQKHQKEYQEITNQALKTIANTIDAKDTYTRGHSSRVAEYSKKLMKAIGGFSEEEQDKIYYMALLHDIGKIGIPDVILNKPGRLTDDEFEMIKSHTTIGAEILKDFTVLSQIGDGALLHHEHYDGTGYPKHKKGEEIPLVAQIIGAADAYDAMATRRPYKDPMPKEKIVQEFTRCSGTQFSPKIAAIMIQLIQENAL